MRVEVENELLAAKKEIECLKSELTKFQMIVNKSKTPEIVSDCAVQESSQANSIQLDAMSIGNPGTLFAKASSPIQQENGVIGVQSRPSS